jgi:hypothetical protein
MIFIRLIQDPKYNTTKRIGRRGRDPEYNNLQYVLSCAMKWYNMYMICIVLNKHKMIIYKNIGRDYVINIIGYLLTFMLCKSTDKREWFLNISRKYSYLEKNVFIILKTPTDFNLQYVLSCAMKWYNMYMICIVLNKHKMIIYKNIGRDYIWMKWNTMMRHTTLWRRHIPLWQIKFKWLYEKTSKKGLHL